MAAPRRARERGAPGAPRAGPRAPRAEPAPPAAEPDARRQVAATLAIGLTLLTVALVATLSVVAPRRTGTNRATTKEAFGTTAAGGGTYCQAFERIPAGSGAMRLSLSGLRGATTPSIAATLADGSRTLARGRLPPRRATGSVVVPLHPVLAREASGRVCVAVGAGGRLRISGQASGSRLALHAGGEALPGRLRIDYYRPGRASWWSFASTVVHRMGLGHAFLGGTAVAPIAALLALAAIVLGSWQLGRRAT